MSVFSDMHSVKVFIYKYKFLYKVLAHAALQCQVCLIFEVSPWNIVGCFLNFCFFVATLGSFVEAWKFDGPMNADLHCCTEQNEMLYI